MTDVRERRLRSQCLVAPAPVTPAEIVGRFGAMQSQEYPGAKWSVGQRVTGVDDAAVQAALDEGSLLRTHVLRPTWHFVRPADIVWLQRLTAPRVHAFNAYHYRQTGVDDELAARGNALIRAALDGGNHLTRTELKAVLAAGGIEAAGVRLAYLIMRAELDALICSGPMRGKQHTYALVRERAPDAVELDQDAALAELTRRYFTSHGPATARDFGWWSSLTAAEVRRGLRLVGSELASEELDGQTYFAAPGRPGRAVAGGPQVLLLHAFDEYLVAYAESKELVQAVVLDGRVAGTWKRILTPKALTVEVSLRVRLDGAQRAALDAAAGRYGRYVGRPATVTTT
jgi:Winged helix DNA-binding domain